MKMILFVFAIISQMAWSIPEKNYQETWHREVIPFYSSGTQRSFVNQQGLKLNYHSFIQPSNKKTIVILPGRTEPAMKYAELVYDLKDLGFNFFILDHQGQGASDRLLTDKHKGYVNQFDHYTQDLTTWMDTVVIPQSKNHERFLIAHSMGGAIGTLYMARHADIFKKAVLSAPMFEVNTKPYKEKIGRLLTSALVLARQGANYAPDRGPYIPDSDLFEVNEVTHSVARFNAAKSIFVTWPELVLGGPTNRWVNQSLKATKSIDTLAPKIKIPILMLQSGMDLIVKPSRQNSFCSKHHACKKIHFANSHHEILQETDTIRDEAMAEIKDFLN